MEMGLGLEPIWDAGAADKRSLKFYAMVSALLLVFNIPKLSQARTCIKGKKKARKKNTMTVFNNNNIINN